MQEFLRKLNENDPARKMPQIQAAAMCIHLERKCCAALKKGKTMTDKDLTAPEAVDTSRARIHKLHSIGCADYLHLALLARAEKAEAERCYYQHMAKVMSDRAAEVEEERDVAVNALSEAATARGRAEGLLRASEMPGIVQGWQRRAEKAEADARTAYARGLEDAAKVADEYAEHSRNQAEGKILAPVHEAIALRVSKRIRALAPDPEDSVG